MTKAVRKKQNILFQNGYMWSKEKNITIFMSYKQSTRFAKTKEGKAVVKMRFAGSSTVLVGHTLQQSNVVSFQHDPPWET